MYCVLNMGYTPTQYINLSLKDRAFIIACIQIKLEEEKKQNRRLQARKSSRRR